MRTSQPPCRCTRSDPASFPWLVTRPVEATAKVHPALTETGPPRPTLLSDETTPFRVTATSATTMISPIPQIEVDVIAEPASVMRLPLVESEMLPPRPPLQEPAV